MKESGETMDSEMAARLAQLEQEFLSTKDSVAELTNGLTEEQFHWQPQPGSWSIGECLTHLNVANEKYLRKMRRELEALQGKFWRKRKRLRHTFIGGIFLRLMEPPVKRRLRAPKVFVPQSRQPLPAVVPRYIQIQNEIATEIRAAADVDWMKIKVTSPVARWIKFNLYDALKVLAAHQRRHLWQAENVKRAAGFPSS